MRTLLIALVALVLIAPVPAQAAVSPSVQKQIDALLAEIDRLKAKVEALNDEDDGGKPYIERTSAKAADNFEMDAGGEATIYGENLLGASFAKTKVTIGGKKASIVSGDDERIVIEVPEKLKAGKTYKLYVRHADGRSNKVNVEILSVLRDDDEDENDDPTLRIKNPLSGHLWTIGDTQEFRWETEDVSSSKYGYIKLTRRGGGTYRIEDVRNSGEYEWKVGSVKGGLDAGTFDVTIVMGDAADTEGPLTIADGDYDGGNGDDAFSIKTEWENTGNDGDYRVYRVELSGGTYDDPVYKWSLDVSCPSNVSAAVAKVWGDTCNSYGNVIYGDGSKGDTDVTFKMLHDAPYSEANVVITAKAIGYDGKSLGKTQFTIPVHKG
jgi:hypothetical protein